MKIIAHTGGKSGIFRDRTLGSRVPKKLPTQSRLVSMWITAANFYAQEPLNLELVPTNTHI